MYLSNFAGAVGLGAAVAPAKAAAQALQAAIAQLGKVVGSSKLAIKADGAIGPATATAVNWAFTNHIGAGQAPAQFRTGKLTVADIKTNVATLTNLVKTEIARRGSAPVSAATVVKAQAAAPASKVDVKRLQNALIALGKAVGSVKLTSKTIGGADGVLGAKTVTAVNVAFTSHIGSGQAPAQFRTGALTLADVKANLSTLTGLVETEARRRGTAGASTGSKPPVQIAAVAKADVRKLQQALVDLGKVAKSAKLTIKTIKGVDGILGDGVVFGVNFAFTNHIGAGQAPAQFRTGRLTINDIKINLMTLTGLIEAEIARRGGKPSVVATTPPKPKKKPVVTPDGQVVEHEEPVVNADGTTTCPAGQYFTRSGCMPLPGGGGETDAGAAAREAERQAACAKDPCSRSDCGVSCDGGRGSGVGPGSGDLGPGTDIGPSVGPGYQESFLDKYKWPLIGVSVLAVVGIGAVVVMKKKRPGSAPMPAIAGHRW